MSHEKAVRDALKINNFRCILALCACSLLCIFVFLGVCIQLLDSPNDLIEEVGWKAYHLFTILSNMLMAATAAMCIPYTVDGLRNHNYHLPRWIINLMFIGTTNVAVTFLVALTVLSPGAGFYRVMFWSNNLHLHTICPLLAILLFFFINSDHRISFRSSLLAIIPVSVYGLLYLTMVFIIGEDAGGWRDHYQIQAIAEKLPLPVLLLLLCLISFGLANGLRAIHNLIHEKRKRGLARYYQQHEVFAYDDIESAIRALARMDRRMDKGGEMTVPRRIMNMMEEKYGSGLSVGEMSKLYIDGYYSEY